ncbi:O-ribose methyltransferase [Podospora australis]|uniref:rRNA methyltransferase 2, mitochondrial n=1 Tax=Podospora australis TaxID=1536484 RepID=A0AAN6X2W1_9PEZI|nr:O-ribose methyltransferase [Podospora australis]
MQPRCLLPRMGAIPKLPVKRVSLSLSLSLSPTFSPLTAPFLNHKQQTRPSSSNRWKARQNSDFFARTAKVQGLKSRAAFKLLELDSKYALFRRGKSQVVVDLGYAPGSWSQVAVDRTAPNGTVIGIDILPAQPPKGVSTIQGNFLSPGVQNMVKSLLLETKKKKDAERRSSSREMTSSEDDEEGEVIKDRPSYIDLERHMALEEEEVAKETATTTSPQPTPSSSSLSEAEEAPKAKAEEKPTPPNLRLVDVVLSDMSEPWPQTYGFSINSISNPYNRMMNTSGISFHDHAGSMDLCRAALSFASETLKPGGHFICKFYQGSEDKDLENLLKKMFVRVHREKPESSRKESREGFFVALKRKADVVLNGIEVR